MNKMNFFIAFTLGSITGSLITLKLVKTKYEQIAQEEINSVKEVYAQKEADVIKNTVDEKKNDTVISDYANIIKSNNYNNHSESDKKITHNPYVISPEEFGAYEDEGYSTSYYTYYADNFLVDENDKIVENIEYTVGQKSLMCFGEFEDDIVHVRNNQLKTDYEISLDERKYSDLVEE